MDSLFSNSHKRDESIYREQTNHFFFKQPLTVFFLILALVAFISNIILLFAPTRNTYAGFLYTAVFLAITAVRYDKYLSDAIKRDDGYCDKETEILSDFYDDFFIYGVNSEAEEKTEYSKIMSVSQSENFIFLSADKKNVYVIDKTGFNSGNSGEFLEFIINKIKEED